jgi:hypothetical protein
MPPYEEDRAIFSSGIQSFSHDAVVDMLIPSQSRSRGCQEGGERH